MKKRLAKKTETVALPGGKTPARRAADGGPDCRHVLPKGYALFIIISVFRYILSAELVFFNRQVNRRFKKILFGFLISAAF